MTWWNDNYLFRRNITLNILDSIPAGHPVTYTISSSILYTLNKVRSDLADIVVVYTTDGQTFTLIPSLASFVGSDIQVEFNTFAPIESSNNTDYYIYYGKLL
jgi:hypothetical protein